ncbi:MAG: T9SS type A sorting domain-containing protein [Bacteroidota bacterium]
MKNIIAACCLLVNLNLNAFAQSGSPDSTFNFDGIAILGPGTLHDVVNAIALQPDQKIVFTGVSRITSTTGFTSDLVIGRLNTDGGLDNGFANNGIFNLASSAGSVFGYDVLIQPDGKIVACGGYSVTASNTEFIVVRINADGTPDNTFGGGDGIQMIPIGTGEDYAYEIVLLSNGNFLLAGTSAAPGTAYKRAVVMRLLPDGSVDSSFGIAGYTTIQVSTTSAETFKCMEVLPSGKIIAAGSSYVNNSDYVFMTAFKPNGELDSTFAVNGVYTGSQINTAFDMAVSGSAIYLAGRISNSGGYDLGIAGFDTTGVALSTFGMNGTVSANYNPIDAALGIKIQPDGKIICVGTSGLGTFNNRDFLVTRYLPDGALDLSFAGTGYAIISIGPSFDEANAVLLQADGKIVVAGFASLGNNEMVFVRLNNDIVVGSNATEDINNMIVYPVPILGSSLRILSSIPVKGAVVCNLFNSMGQLVSGANIECHGNFFELPVPVDLPAGTYMLRVRSGNNSFSRLIIK